VLPGQHLPKVATEGIITRFSNETRRQAEASQRYRDIGWRSARRNP